ncbi:DNA topoisomerase 6 subunit B-like [Arachis ipaensis]|uniref:DNA topoisomerase 6 subunit B-like n=1 Tax=Arachis ipaensis TaxID=130454 RepID=UPI000A2B4997|nr:DNA topoisomerase 6 subunit B-like [Arachis ipaensis]
MGENAKRKRAGRLLQEFRTQTKNLASSTDSTPPLIVVGASAASSSPLFQTKSLARHVVVVLSSSFAVRGFEFEMLAVVSSSSSCSQLKPGKSLYTTVRELVENSLDSAESISELPVVEITM